MNGKFFVLFNKHLNLEGTHAFLGASNYHWINYDETKLVHAFTTAQAARRGTELHDFARRAIRLGIKLPDTQETLYMYVNDAIKYGMVPEQILFYSINCYGTADTIGFRRGKLRIHDYKSGVSRTSEKQLYVYAALFCLEYGIKPTEIETELRIYQSDEVRVYEAEWEFIVHIMDRIVTFDKLIEAQKQEALD
jgi:hypothetical protein